MAQSKALSSLPITLDWALNLNSDSSAQGRAALPIVHALCTQLALFTQSHTAQQQPFLTLGGDHSAAIGTWSGVSSIVGADTLGLIWFDAHMDSHTFGTTPSQNIHGMPLAALLGEGEPELTQLLTPAPKLKPENVWVMGLRNYEPDEAERLRRLNVRCVEMQEIKTKGMRAVMSEALEQLLPRCKKIGISIDLDGIDPKDVPGVGTPEPDGVRLADFIDSLNLLRQRTPLVGAEIAEFNPSQDIHHQTEKAIAEIIRALYR